MAPNHNENIILENDVRNLKYLLMADGLSIHINEVINILSKIIQCKDLTIFDNPEIKLFLLVLEKILETEDISNIFIKMCISYIKTGYIINNLLEESSGFINTKSNNNSIENKKEQCCTPIKTEIKNNKLTIKNVPENYEEYLIDKIPDFATPGYYFKNIYKKDDIEIEDTYFLEENGEVKFINSIELREPELSNMFANLLGDEIIEENDL